MKITKELLIKIGFFLAVAVVLSALFCTYVQAQVPVFPLPIVGEVSNIESNILLTVEVTNQRTGLSMIGDIQGRYYLVEWANSPPTLAKYANGDVFKVVIRECKDNPKCVNSAVYHDGDPEVKVDFDLAETFLPKCPDINLTTVLAALFSLITGGALLYVYRGKIFLKKEKMEELVNAMPKGCGIRLFRPYSGNAEIKHFHRSPKTYHSLSARHKGIYDHKGEENLFPNL